MKLAVIGGASSYTPELIDGLFAHLEALPFTEVWMMDPNAERLAITSAFSIRMSEARGAPFTIHTTSDLDEAVRDAAFVVTQVRVGGGAARIQDEKLGMRHGIIGQETTGIGGFAKALRTIPVILEVAHAMEREAPDGTLVNFTNPAGIVTEAVLKHSTIRTVGLCNIPIGYVIDTAKLYSAPTDAVSLDYVGLNHLAWVRGFSVDGQDVTPDAWRHFYEHADEEWSDDAVRKNMCAAMASLGMVCNPYLQYFYARDAAVAAQERKPRTRGEEVVEIEETLFQKYAEPGSTEKPAELSKRGGVHYSTAAFQLMKSIHNDTKSRQIVCCRNEGAVPTFDNDVSVEVSAVIDREGAHAIPQGPPPAEIRGLMQLIKAYESLTVKAAVTGDRETAYHALLGHPLLPGAAGCREVLDELLEINRPYLHANFYSEEGACLGPNQGA